MKNRIRDTWIPINVSLSRRPPFIMWRFPYRSRHRMLKALGPQLGAEVSWSVSDTPSRGGDLTSIFDSTQDILKWTHYLPIYESALSEFRSRPIRMMEIGVFKGGSLQMWRQYLHPESVIVGIDIDATTSRFDNPSQGIHVRIGGQQDVFFLQRVVSELGPFDVILDDGSHMASHMVRSFRYLFANGLASGGVYIVEDIHANYWREFRDSPVSFVDFTKWLIEAMHAHYQVTDGYLNFHVGDPHRLTEISVPLATTLIEKVEFYDSIALIHRAKGRRVVPSSVGR
ncbi:class I SAM-dependent methyltransferase [Mycobacterium seoulense]|uniref:class I SAM-dependent methyltransferase n=1 Tax=Mycobacterium seoulense TaxID=386911 RepID=UPI003CE81B0C